MSLRYDDAKHNVVERHWFGLTQKAGGSGTVLTFNESEATKITRWYAKGPIQIRKVGVMTLATLGKGEEAFNLKVDNTNTVTSVIASTTSAPYTIASTVLDTPRTVSQSSYLTLIESTNVASTGSCAVFVEYVRGLSTRHDLGVHYE